MTGDFTAYERKEATRLLEQLGADVTGSVSGKTMAVIAGAKPGQAKLSAAKKHNLPVLNEAQMLELLGGQTLGQVLAKQTGQQEPESKLESKSESKLESKSESKPESKSESKSESTTDFKKTSLPMPFVAARPWNGLYQEFLHQPR